MLQFQFTQPSPEQSAPATPTLADLSRNASVISTNSSSSSSSSLVMPVRPRPIRTFSSPRSRSPNAPVTPRASRPPQYLSKELGLPDPDEDPRHSPSRGPQSRAPSRPRSRTNSVNGRFGADDFNFGDIVGEGSYSTVRNTLDMPVMHGSPVPAGHAGGTPSHETRVRDQSPRQGPPRTQQQTSDGSHREEYPR